MQTLLSPLDKKMEPEEKFRPARASDTYVPMTLLIHAISTIGGLVAIWVAISGSITSQEKRLTTIEVRMERITEITEQLSELDSRCRPK